MREHFKFFFTSSSHNKILASKTVHHFFFFYDDTDSRPSKTITWYAKQISTCSSQGWRHHLCLPMKSCSESKPVTIYGFPKVLLFCSAEGGGCFLLKGRWECTAGWDLFFVTGLAIMGLIFHRIGSYIFGIFKVGKNSGKERFKNGKNRSKKSDLSD